MADPFAAYGGRELAGDDPFAAYGGAMQREPPSLGQQAETAFGTFGNAIAQHLVPEIGGMVHAGLDSAQDFVGRDSLLGRGLEAVQGTSFEDAQLQAELHGQGSEAYEQALRGYFAELEQQAPTVAAVSDFAGSAAGGMIAPVSRAGGITGLARTAATDAGLAGVDMYGRTGDVRQVPQAMVEGAGLSAGFNAGGKALGGAARGVGAVTEGVGGALRGIAPVARQGADMMQQGAQIARTVDPTQLTGQVKGAANEFFDSLQDPTALATRANEGNAVAAGMRLQPHRKRVEGLPGPITGFEPRAIVKERHAFQDMGRFKADEFASLPFEQQQQYLSDRLPEIGEGIGRRVFALGDDKVLKLSNKAAGRDIQNQTELNVFRSVPEDMTGSIPGIHEAGPDNSWLVADRMRPITDEALGGPGQMDILFEVLNSPGRSPSGAQRIESLLAAMTPQTRAAYDRMAALRDRMGVGDFTHGNAGIDAEGGVRAIDTGAVRDRMGFGDPLREPAFPQRYEQPDMPRVQRGEGGVQGYGTDLERLGIAQQPNLAGVKKRATEVTKATGAMRGDIVRQLAADSGEIDSQAVAAALNARADEIGKRLNKGSVVGQLRMAAKEVAARDADNPLQAEELWKSIQENASSVNRNTPADVVAFNKELESVWNQALDRWVWGNGGDEVFKAWKHAGRDFQVAVTAREQAQDMIRRGQTNRSIGLLETIAGAGALAAGGPLGLVGALGGIAGTKMLRNKEKHWEGQIYRYLRDQAQAGNPAGAQQVERARGATMGAIDAGARLQGMAPGLLDTGAAALRGLGGAANLTGGALQGAGAATGALGRGLQAAAPYAGRTAALQQDPPYPQAPPQQQQTQVDPRVMAYAQEQAAYGDRNEATNRIRRAVVDRKLPAGSGGLEQLVHQGADDAQIAAKIQELQLTNPAFARWLRGNQ